MIQDSHHHFSSIAARDDDANNRLFVEGRLFRTYIKAFDVGAVQRAKSNDASMDVVDLEVVVTGGGGSK
jgi:hypothetical protein